MVPAAVTTVETDRSVQDIERAFGPVARRFLLSVLGVRDLRREMAGRGLDVGKDCLVFEVCSPRQVSRVLAHRTAVATALPCRVAVYAEGGRTKISLLNPLAVLDLFGAPGLLPMADKIQDRLISLIETLAGGDPCPAH